VSDTTRERNLDEHRRAFEASLASFAAGFEREILAGNIYVDHADLLNRFAFGPRKKELIRHYSIPYFDNIYPFIRFTEGMNVLVIGSGFGMDIKTLYSRYAPPALNVYGIEISATDTRIAILNRTQGVLSQGVAEALPYPDGFFDVIISCEVFEHVADPSAMLSEIQRTARPGCQVFIGTPNGMSWSYVHLYERIYGLLTGRRFMPRAIPDNHYTPAEVAAMVEKSAPGMRLSRRIFDMPFYFVAQAVPESLARLVPVIASLTRFTSRTPFFNRIFCDQAKYFFAVEKERGSVLPATDDAFVCPRCHGALNRRDDALACSACAAAYPLVHGLIQFQPLDEGTADAVGELTEESVKKNGVGRFLRQILIQSYNLGEFVLWTLLTPIMAATRLLMGEKR
jgi:2-polyprenyl-3-methyl-5-hydroxy-6-metoxy-1,4-benzoquinol methylase